MSDAMRWPCCYCQSGECENEEHCSCYWSAQDDDLHAYGPVPEPDGRIVVDARFDGDVT